ncbi:MAG: hypothetical protein V3T84_07705 [Phycisphaerales bacterium]
MTDANWIDNSFLGIDGSLQLFTKSTLTSSGVEIGANGSVMIGTDSIWSVGGFLTMFGGGDASLSISNFATVTATVFQAGMDAGLISLTIDSGGSLVLSDPIQNSSIAQHAESNVTVIVDDGNWFNAGPLAIGEAGTATLTIQNSGNVFCSEARIASQPGSVGTVTDPVASVHSATIKAVFRTFRAVLAKHLTRRPRRYPENSRGYTKISPAHENGQVVVTSPNWTMIEFDSFTHRLPLVSSVWCFRRMSGVQPLNMTGTSLERQAGEVLFSVHLPECCLLTLGHTSG